MAARKSFKLTNEELLTAAEVVAAYPGASLTEMSLRRWARNGQIPVITLPSGRFRFRRSDIEQLLTPRLATSDVSSEVPGQQELPW